MAEQDGVQVQTRSFRGVPIVEIADADLELYIRQRLPRILSDLPHIKWSHMTDAAYATRWVARAMKRFSSVAELAHRLTLQQTVIQGILSLIMSELHYESTDASKHRLARDITNEYLQKYADFYMLAMDACHADDDEF
ncbi:hypothetical protein AURDEDRAFT_176435 [Auricularia subglabra TFB-10046 SS5]|uniref:Uncharacterized protein n=1 Tax=Auricularia subglabra (strain TFB-10046 / SS5) TaxID=717982 RepID=J0CVR9_AURST|nr:hypothetical protein AURDEDRAFT_176435 [Auricularia subglabra TFB-10046 SS5]